MGNVYWVGDTVFAKNSVPSSNQQQVHQTCANPVHDLFISGISTFGSFCHQMTKSGEKSEGISQRQFGGNLKALVGGVSVGVKYQKTGKTSWTTSCPENL